MSSPNLNASYQAFSLTARFDAIGSIQMKSPFAFGAGCVLGGVVTAVAFLVFRREAVAPLATHLPTARGTDSAATQAIISSPVPSANTDGAVPMVAALRQ